MSGDKMAEMRRGGIASDSKELINKVKQTLNQAIGGMVGVEQALRKAGSQGGVVIN
jgi:hypothetical protein